MAVKIPSFADLGFGDPRASTALPNYPANDPGSEGLAVLGKGVAAAGAGMLALADDQKRKQNKINATLAEVHLDGNLMRFADAAKNERDPAKLDALTAELPGYLNQAGATITDPETRQLWAATHELKINAAKKVAIEQHRKIYNDSFIAGASQQLDEQARLAAQASDPGMREQAKRNIGNIIGSLAGAGIIGAAKEQELMSGYGEKVIIGTVNWLDANKDPIGAGKYLRENLQHIDPAKAESLSRHLRPMEDREIGRAWKERTRSGAVSGGDAGERHINFGGTGALGDPNDPGWREKNITSVSAPSGAKFNVNKAAAADFSGFLKELEATGYKIDTHESGGHSHRKMKGGDTLSEHAYGAAIDINPSRNPYSKEGKKVTDLPGNVAEIAAKYNLEWGGNWTSPVDTMHFQWRGPRGAADAAPDRVDNWETRNNNFGGIRKKGVVATAAEGGFESYATPEQGVQAIADNLRRYAAGGVTTVMNPEGKLLNTLRGIISTWAPPTENRTDTLIARAVKTTGFSADQSLDLNNPATMAKVIEATIRNEQGGKLPVSPAIITKVAGATGGAPVAPGVPDVRAWVDRIRAAKDAGEITEQQADIAIAEIQQEQKQVMLGHENTESDLTLAVARGEKGSADIEDAYSAQRISPATRTRLQAHIIEEGKKQALRDQAILRVSAAGSGGAPLDPKSTEDRKALNLHYDAVSTAWPAEETIDRGLAYSARYGLVPTALQARIRGGLHSGRPELAIEAARTVNRLRNANPQLVGEIGDENDLRLAALISARDSMGVPSERSVQMAVDELKAPKAVREARDEEYEARGKTALDRRASDTLWIEKQQNSLWVNDPNVDPMMRREFDEIAKAEFQKTGNLEASRRMALDNINRVWGRSSVGGDLRYMKFAPEKFYGAATLSDDDNAAWMRDQLVADVAKGAFVEPGNPITPERIKLLAAPAATQGGLPVYQVWLTATDGSWQQVVKLDGNPIAWKPEWATSAEFKRRQEAQQGGVNKARQLRQEEQERIRAVR